MLTVAFYGKIYRLCVVFGFFCKYPRGPKEYKDDVLHYCNRLFLCLNSKFDELKKIHLLKKLPNFVLYLKFFLKCKTDLRNSKTKSMQKRCLVFL